MSKVQKKYTKETKLKAVDMYLNKHIGANTIAKELGLSEKKRVYDWVKKYQAEGDKAFDIENRGKKSKIQANGSRKGRPKTKFSSIEEEVEYLRMENEFLKKLQALIKE
ncbi:MULTISPECIES: transposase [unclassified Clostridium]|uniref:transposase n=1 Tax=unclassified Clostridium TaxID=2614128 RepID=UPI0029141C8D|nr:transposase [Clostridium sp.]MDU5108732.1 helix-turn-helix domain-containing protein [Clostridium sp.]